MISQSRPAAKIGLLSEPSRTEIDREIAKYPPDRKQAAVMAALRIAQEQNGGWLPADLIEAVAEYLEMPAIAVHEVATFYTMYDLKPVGRHKVCVCTNISCLLNGSNRIMNHLETRLGIAGRNVSRRQIHPERGRMSGRLRRRADDDGRQDLSRASHA